jgi:hypothetical protein
MKTKRVADTAARIRKRDPVSPLKPDIPDQRICILKQILDPSRGWGQFVNTTEEEQRLNRQVLDIIKRIPTMHIPECHWALSIRTVKYAAFRQIARDRDKVKNLKENDINLGHRQTDLDLQMAMFEPETMFSPGM